MNNEYIKETKEDFWSSAKEDFWRNKILIILSAISADEYEYSNKTNLLDRNLQ